MPSARVGQKEIIVLFMAFIGTTYGFGMYLFPAIAESIRQDIDFSHGTMGLIFGYVQFGFIVSSAATGFLTLRFGAINLILFSIIACGLSLGAVVFAGSVHVLAALLLILGTCAALIWVPMVEVSREIIPLRNRGKALGLMSSGTSYGVLINSALLAVALPVHGWRGLWGITCLLATLLAVYALVRLAPLRKHHDGHTASLPTVRPRHWGRVFALPRQLVGIILLMMFLNGFACVPFQTYLSTYLIGEAGFEEAKAASA